ncbi:gap junction delta-4 protein [Sciurus carolinensis]|uniref:gap junction delta-4 protein n=1 Tax=Sciurus carolinensis TaxID=30640 RepID=UPI001FB364EE|nr:gap junction delta-4 protein [Sciurus carolinensis]
MENLDLLGFLIITLNCNVTIVGKIWLIFMILLRMVVLILAGYPIYQDEQERFVCNTLQPGCANVCYDIFSPVSHLRFWLIQSVSVLLPYVVFSVYVLHQGAQLAAHGACRSDGGATSYNPSDLTTGERHCTQLCREGCSLSVPDFSSGYIIHLFFRTLMEAAFGALHYLLFGFFVPKRFSCTHSPCSSVVDCYISRPTEKSIMMLFIWAVSVLSFLFSIIDLICSVRRRMGRKRGPRNGHSFPVGKECGAMTSPPIHTEGCEASQSLGKRPSEMDEDGRWEEEGEPTLPGVWTREKDANSPSGKLGQVESPDEDGSEVMSSASERLIMAHKEPGGRPHREATQDPRSKGPAKSEQQPSASRSHLAGHYSCSQLQRPDRLATSGSTPHLRTKKSEWV